MEHNKNGQATIYLLGHSLFLAKNVGSNFFGFTRVKIPIAGKL